MGELDPQETESFVGRVVEDEILPALERYIGIPNKSPAFDPDWAAAGHMGRAVALAADWCRARAVPDLAVEVVELPGRTPLLWLESPGQGPAGARPDTVLLYGHLDKQPEMEGWRAGLGPWQAVREGDRLYGRGGADDGYAAFASLAALEALARQGVPRARCVALVECSEESGSPDLPAYIDHLAPRIGTPSLVVCLDSGCGDYERLWATTSLRGMVGGTLRVDVLEEGVHSGDASGVVPSSFRILRRLLSRLEDEASGTIRLDALRAEVPPDRRAQARTMAAVLGDGVHEKYPFAGGTRPMGADPTERILARTWRPTLSVTGIDGVPPIASAGNVLRPHTAAKLSLRLPPTVDGAAAAEAVRALLEADPPCGARVRFSAETPATGWNAPAFAPWLEAALETASRDYFGPPAAFMGEGGTIPFMAMLGERFPQAQFLITGVLGPGSNAHGPNEFLHVPTLRRITCAVASVLADHARRAGAGPA